MRGLPLASFCVALPSLRRAAARERRTTPPCPPFAHLVDRLAGVAFQRRQRVDRHKGEIDFQTGLGAVGIGEIRHVDLQWLAEVRREVLGERGSLCGGGDAFLLFLRNKRSSPKSDGAGGVGAIGSAIRSLQPRCTQDGYSINGTAASSSERPRWQSVETRREPSICAGHHRPGSAGIGKP